MYDPLRVLAATCALAASLCCLEAGAAVHRIEMPLYAYAQRVLPAPLPRSINVPVFATLTDAGTLGLIIHGNHAYSPNLEEFSGYLQGAPYAGDAGALLEAGGFPGLLDALSQSLRGDDTSGPALSSLRFPAALLIRYKPRPPGEAGPITVRDDRWESALLQWQAVDDARELIILSLDAN